MSLKFAVDSKRREISSDNLSMSIGELLNLYKDQELDIHPEFQRIFRWSIQQKSRLIESLLLGIPLPSIYVSTNERGIWEVIDGVQRLSTIFEFMGELRGPISDESEEFCGKPAIALEGTKHLPELSGVTFGGLDQTLKLEFKRTRLDVKILSRETQGTGKGKFDLFERLNTYGQPLSPQELRNCILVSLNPDLFRWLKKLSENEDFRACLMLSDAQLQEKYDMDLALRFITLREANISTIGDVHEFLRDKMENIATAKRFAKKKEETLFKEVFSFLASELGENAFRSWSQEKSSFRGGLSLAAFEGLGLSLARHWGNVKPVVGKFDIERVVREIWSQPEYVKSFSGLRARERMTRVTPAAEMLVKAEIARVSG